MAIIALVRLGLGDLGIRYGYQRFMPDVMLAVVLVLIVLVQLVQSAGDRLAHSFDWPGFVKRRSMRMVSCPRPLGAR